MNFQIIADAQWGVSSASNILKIIIGKSLLILLKD